jgi:ElaB/YqjD/DUF883 family membrane-anchored ribosome-binding protein
MDERTGQIINDLLRERERLGDNVAELERKIKTKVSWRGYFAKKPWTVLAIAAGGGFLVSRMLVRLR